MQRGYKEDEKGGNTLLVHIPGHGNVFGNLDYMAKNGEKERRREKKGKEKERERVKDKKV